MAEAAPVDPIEEPSEPETPETPPVSAKADHLDFSKVPREYMPYIEQARAQEKQKLYKERTALKSDIQELQRKLEALESKPPEPTSRGRKKEDDDKDDLRQSILELKDQIKASEQRALDAARRAELRQYRTERIASMRADGNNLVESLVMGDTEEAIDAAIEVARAEYAVIHADVERKLAATKKPTTVVVTTAGSKQPAGVPPTVAAAEAGDRSTTLSLEDVKDLTSIEAIRDGRYAKHRAEIMAAMRQGKLVSTAGKY